MKKQVKKLRLKKTVVILLAGNDQVKGGYQPATTNTKPVITCYTWCSDPPR